MLVFVDESGDTGFKFESGSSPNFTIAAVIFDDESPAIQCRNAVADLRRSLGFRSDFEFKFNRSEDRVRMVFLTHVVQYRFRYYSFTLDKPKLSAGALRQKNRLYSKVVTWVFENAMPTLRDATVMFDKAGQRDLYKMIEQYLRVSMQSTGNHGAVKRVVAKDSKEDDLLQLADMVCGAVARSFSSKPNAGQYRSILQKREILSRLWP